MTRALCTHAALAERFERALSRADGIEGAHCVHEWWMRGEMSLNIERADAARIEIELAEALAAVGLFVKGGH